MFIHAGIYRTEDN